MSAVISEGSIEKAITQYVSKGPGVSVSKAIPELSKKHAPNKVRNVYWKLVSEGKVRRAPNGALTLP